MKPLALIALFALACPAWPPPNSETSVNALIGVVRAGLEAKEPDKQLAKSVSKLHMDERIDLQVLEELQSEGAGPAVLEELELLREDAETALPPKDPLPFEAPARPALEEMRATIQAARTYALGYAKSLPDFLCDETVKRFEDPGRRGRWYVKDTLFLHLSYADQHEEYKLISINNKPAKVAYDAITGAISEGEFGSMMYAVFHPDSRSRITWDHWTKLRGRPAQVYSYVINPANSSYHMAFGEGGDRITAEAGASGEVYIDPATNAVVRLTRTATGLPGDFPITLAWTMLDYNYGEVGGKRFFLPTHATVRMETRSLRLRNEVEFSGYRKFEGESTISFSDAPPVKK